MDVFVKIESVIEGNENFISEQLLNLCYKRLKLSRDLIKSCCLPYHGNMGYAYLYNSIEIWDDFIQVCTHILKHIHGNMHLKKKTIYIRQKEGWIWSLLHLNITNLLTVKCTRLKYREENNLNISSPGLQIQIPGYLWYKVYIYYNIYIYIYIYTP